MTKKITAFFQKPFWSDYRTLLGLWLLLGVVSAVTKIGKWNNFLIFRGVFWHTWNGTSLYAPYPEEYFDTNHYGPLFSLIIAPFAVCPEVMGCILWNTLMALALWVAVRRLPAERGLHILIYWFCAHELLTALFMQQFNVAVCAIIVATYVCVEKEKDHWATLLILIGTFVKLYGIVGLCFFLFSRHKIRFIWTFIAWGAVLFALPMLISSPEYVVSQYQEWYASLTEKNASNMFNPAQNISLLGLVRKLSALVVGREAAASYSDLWLIVPGCLMFAAPYLRFSQWASERFRRMFLASVLLFVVLFSTGSESSGYIIALVGVSLWYGGATWKRGAWAVALMVFVFIVTSMSPSDLFPRYVRSEIIQPYALKALPCVIVWLTLIYEMMTKDFRSPKENL